ncbi:MAG: TetR family transcriptional regulator [Acidimicrobiales bacterium]|nr:TetR family transcriptional regulator [Acidimicrobiales bacterium]
MAASFAAHFLCGSTLCAESSYDVNVDVAGKRSYDAAKRKARAAVERDATRRKVVEAARDLFASRGYVATTVQDIATEAGVALQSVYNAGGSKAELLHLAADLAVAGDHGDQKLVARPAIGDIGAEPDLRRQLAMFARFVATTIDRALPIFTAEREAAAVDPRAAAHLQEARSLRLETFRGIVRLLALDQADGVAATPAAVDELATTIWSIASPEVFLLQSATLAWSGADFEPWLIELFTRLVAPRPPTQSGRPGRSGRPGKKRPPGRSTA